MSNKPNIFISSFSCKCPNCGKGKLFTYSNPYRYSKMSVMPDNCSVCGVSFKNREPGFYWGSMYVSYGLSAAMMLFNLLWIHYFFGWNMMAIIIPNVILLIVLAPFNFRISRALWLAIDMRFIDKKQ